MMCTHLFVNISSYVKDKLQSIEPHRLGIEKRTKGEQIDLPKRNRIDRYGWGWSTGIRDLSEELEIENKGGTMGRER